MENYDKNSIIAIKFKELRKTYGISQTEFALRSGLGLRFVRELEQGKTTLKLDKVLDAFNMFGYELVPERKKTIDE